MSQIPPSAQEMIARNDHIREIFDKLVERLKTGQFKEVNIELALKPDVVPDITRMTQQEDTLVAVVSMQLSARRPDYQLDDYKDIIDGVHSRSVVIAGVAPDHSFSVAYNIVKSPIHSLEFFRTYHDTEKDGIEVWASEVAAEKIWDFLLKGITPPHDRQTHKRGQTE